MDVCFFLIRFNIFRIAPPVVYDRREWDYWFTLLVSAFYGFPLGKMVEIMIIRHGL